MMKTGVMTGMLAIALAVWMGNTAAIAATITVEASGQVANTTYGSFTSGGRLFQTASLILQPNDPLPLELNDGDVIEYSITLDGAFAVPAAGEQFFGLNFYGAEDQQSAGASNTGTMMFEGAVGLPVNPAPIGCGNCLSLIYGAGNAGPFSFTGLTGSTTVTLAVPYSVDEISISYQVSNPVPEPAGWAMMIAGFGLVGGLARTRRSRAQLA